MRESQSPKGESSAYRRDSFVKQLRRPSISRAADCPESDRLLSYQPPSVPALSRAMRGPLRLPHLVSPDLKSVALNPAHHRSISRTEGGPACNEPPGMRCRIRPANAPRISTRSPSPSSSIAGLSPSRRWHHRPHPCRPARPCFGSMAYRRTTSSANRARATRCRANPRQQSLCLHGSEALGRPRRSAVPRPNRSGWI